MNTLKIASFKIAKNELILFGDGKVLQFKIELLPSIFCKQFFITYCIFFRSKLFKIQQA